MLLSSISTSWPTRTISINLAFIWLGMLLIIASVVCVALPVLGLSCIMVGAGALLVPMVTSVYRGGPPVMIHVCCALLAAMAAFGLCATHCGSYAQYAEFLGIPTVIAACALHLAVAIVLMANQRYPGHLEGTAVGAVSAAIGASAVFASIQLRLGVWCSACAAIHVLMAVQAVVLIRQMTGIRRAAVVLGILASAGLVNAVYHHAPPPAAPDDPQELLAYLRSAWTSPDPPQRITVRAVDPAAVRQDGAAIAQQLAAAARALQPGASLTAASAQEPQQAMLGTTVRGSAYPHVNQPGALRSVSDANRWGSAQAAVTLLVKLDTGCPVCARQFAQLLELEDLMAAGALQVRFLVGYRNDASQASASLAYVGGLVSEQALLAVLTEAFRHQSDILVPADAVATLPAALPQARALDLLRRHREEVSALLADAQRTAERLGSTGDPTLWLMAPGESTPRQHFDGLTLADVLRAAIAGMAQGAGGRDR